MADIERGLVDIVVVYKIDRLTRSLADFSKMVDEIVMGLHQLGEAWEQLYPAERIRIVKLMIERVDLVAGGLKVKWHALGWKELIKEFAAKGIGAELVEMETA